LDTVDQLGCSTDTSVATPHTVLFCYMNTATSPGRPTPPVHSCQPHRMVDLVTRTPEQLSHSD
ncbi:hypothetical protein Bpfe_024096, partial [Biomphalaria pfeifferi]